MLLTSCVSTQSDALFQAEVSARFSGLRSFSKVLVQSTRRSAIQIPQLLLLLHSQEVTGPMCVPGL